MAPLVICACGADLAYDICRCQTKDAGHQKVFESPIWRPFIDDQPVDLARMAEISGREESYLYGLLDQIKTADRIKLPALSAELIQASFISTAMMAFVIFDGRGDKIGRSLALVRWIQLCQTETDFRNLAPKIMTGTELEIYFLWHLSRICPGE